MSTDRSFAQGTKVSVSATQADIMAQLARFGVKQRAFYDDSEGALAVAFSYGGLSYRMSILMPPEDHEAFHFTANGRRKEPAAARAAYDGEIRRRWRSLLLAIKAKLVAVDDEIATFEQEFLAYAVTGDGRTVGEVVIPQVVAGAKAGTIPSSLVIPGANGAKSLPRRGSE